MTEKRFTLLEDGYYDCPPILDDGEELGHDDVLDLLNTQHEQIQLLQFQLQECREHKLFSRRELENENEQLKERNNRQAKRLAELYELMAKKDWESLTEIIDDFCSCE